MNQSSKVAVCSRSFSLHPVLRQELLQEFRNVKFNDEGKSLRGDELVSFLKGADRAIIALEEIDESILKQLPELKVIGKYGVGLDKIDFSSMEKCGVKMGFTPGVNAQSVAELALTLSLNIIRNISTSHELVKNKGWKQISGKQMSSMTFGILGCGHVGKKLVKLLRPFGCKILVCDIVTQKAFYEENGVKEVALDELLRESDIVSLHIPKNSSTQNILNKQKLSLMKKGSFLVNTARGGLVDEKDLIELLNEGHLSQVAFDVFLEEPPISDSLAYHPKCYSTTHIGGSSEEAVLAMGRAAIKGLSQFSDASAYEQYR